MKQVQKQLHNETFAHPSSQGHPAAKQTSGSPAPVVSIATGKPAAIEPAIANPKTDHVEGAEQGSSKGASRVSRIETLLVLEAQVRDAANLRELKYLIANETQKLIPAGQVFLHAKGKNGKSGKLEMASSISQIDRNSPVVRWLEAELETSRKRASEVGGQTTNALKFAMRASGAPGKPYPFRQVLQVPLISSAKEVQFGTLTLLNDSEFSQSDVAMAERLAGTYAHALSAFGRGSSFVSAFLGWRTGLAVLLLGLMAAFIPVPLTVLAPVEVVARNPVVVAAPLNGVVRVVEVSPGDHVSKGDRLFSYVRTDLESETDVARQQVMVATARYNKAAQEAFGSGSGKRELAVSKAEMALSKAQYDHAAAKLAQADVAAVSSGIVLFKDHDEWTGRPVSTGERIMRIADPGEVMLKIELATGDATGFEEGAPVKVFLDADPLNARSARLVSYNYEASMTDRETLAYELQASIEMERDAPVNDRWVIGQRGTAQIAGEDVKLGFFLLRKPISAIRQFIGF